jgi:hypothetical protein
MLDLYLSTLVCSGILIFEYFNNDSVGDQYFDWRVGRVPYFSTLPEEGTPVSKHVRVHTGVLISH